MVVIMIYLFVLDDSLTSSAHSAYDMFSKYKYLNVNLVFPHLGFWSASVLLIVPFPDHCLLVPFLKMKRFFFFIMRRSLILCLV